MKKIVAIKLKNIPFPECTKTCALIEVLGAGECENVNFCKYKFSKQKIMNKKG